MMRSWKLGRFFGIDVHIHWTFLLVPLWVVFNNLQMGTLALAPYTLALVLAVFGCVVLHEYGHALTARRFGIGTRDITLYPIGGVARLERMSERPWEEFWIALAGPAVNVVIAVLLVPLVVLHGSLVYSADDPAAFFQGNLLLDLAIINVILVAFNMLPAFPSDGGRVLRAVLAMRMSRLRATEIAAQVGIVTAIGIALILGLYFKNYMAIAVVLFLIFAGQQELAAVRYQERLRQAEPLTAMPVDEVVTSGSPTMRYGGFSGILWDPRLRVWVQWRDGQPVHFVS